MMDERITVAVAGEGRHLFDMTRDPRVRLDTVEARDPDLMVFPCGRFRRFENVAELELRDTLRERIAAGRVGLVFDSSLEGVAHKPDITAALHGVLQRLGAHPRQCVYLTQDRQYEADYRTHCATLGVEPVSVLTHDYWIWYALSHYETNGPALFEEASQAYRARRRRRSRKFVCLNRTPRPVKILWLLCLLRDGLWEQGFISFGGFRGAAIGPGKERPTLEQLQRALPGFEDLVGTVARFLEVLDAHGRVMLGAEQHGWNRVDMITGSLAVDLAECHDAWFTVVTETEMRARPSRITEKVIKPLVNFHPFLVLGNPEALAMVREYGFVTFDEVFDESYDREWDPRRRFDQVYEQLVRCCRRSDDDWQRLGRVVEEKLIFNARRAMTTFPTAFRRDSDMALTNRLRGAVNARTPAYADERMASS